MFECVLAKPDDVCTLLYLFRYKVKKKKKQFNFRLTKKEKWREKNVKNVAENSDEARIYLSLSVHRVRGQIFVRYVKTYSR